MLPASGVGSGWARKARAFKGLDIWQGFGGRISRPSPGGMVTHARETHLDPHAVVPLLQKCVYHNTLPVRSPLKDVVCTPCVRLTALDSPTLPHHKKKAVCAQSLDLTEMASQQLAPDGGLMTRGREGLEPRAALGSQSRGSAPQPGFVVSLSNRKTLSFYV